MSTPRSRSLRGIAGSSQLWTLVSGFRRSMVLLSVVSFVGALCEALFLVVVTGIAKTLIAQEATVGPIRGVSISVGFAVAAGAVVLLVRFVLELAKVWISTRLTAAVTADRRRILSQAYLGASWSIHQNEPSGRLQELLTSFVQRINNAIQSLARALAALLSLLAFLASGFVVDPLTTTAALVALALFGAILTPIRRHIRGRSAVSARARLDFAAAVSELGSLGLEMQTYGVRQRFDRSIDDLIDDVTRTERRTQELKQSLAPVYMTLAYGAMLAGIGVLTLIGVGDLAAVGAVLLLMLRSLSYGQQLITASGELSSAGPFLDRIAETVQRYHDAPASGGPAIPPHVTPIEARNVNFAYTPDRQAVTDVSFRIVHGEAIGVVGPSGAGKSTLAQLLLGLEDPSDGLVCAGGVDLRTVERSWWSRRVAFVAQDARLLTGTVAENIRFFRDYIDDAAIYQAAQQANIMADIEKLPQRFDTHLGEKGSQLSGGQRQRLSIARALAGRPELLVLDEPTSALDGTSEALIRETMTRLKGSMTVTIIAHRMSTLDICDRIMVIEQGRLTAFDQPTGLHTSSNYFQHAMAVAGLSTPGAG